MVTDLTLLFTPGADLLVTVIGCVVLLLVGSVETIGVVVDLTIPGVLVTGFLVIF